MDLEGIMLVRQRQMPYVHTYIQNLNNNINEKTKQKQAHRYKDQTSRCHRRGGLGGWVKEIKN